MKNSDQESYQEGYEDACQHFEKTHIPLENVLDSIDKFLDKINKLKNINKHLYNHFKNGLTTESKEIKDTKEKKENLEKILKMIEEENKNNVK